MIDVPHTRHDWIVLRANELFTAGRERKVAMAMATDEWPKSAHGKLCAEITALRDQMELVKKHINQRPEYVIALKDGGSGDSADYHRWTGNAEGRRQLAEDLHWTVPHNPGDRTRPKPAEVNGNICAEGNSSPTVAHVHPQDLEAHAASFNEGFEEAVRRMTEPAQTTINSTLHVPAPAEPAEEEKLVAHRDSKGDIYVGHALVAFKHRSYEQIRRWFNEAHPGGISERRYRAVLDLLDVEASLPVVPAPAEASVIGDAAVALRAALAVVDPHETGPWEHAWLAVNDLEDCASRAEAIALTETRPRYCLICKVNVPNAPYCTNCGGGTLADAGPWPSLDAVPANVRKVRDREGDLWKRRKSGGWKYRLPESEVWHESNPAIDYSPECAPFVAVEEQKS